MKHLLVLVAAIALLPVSATAIPGDPRALAGTLEWAPGAGPDSFIVVRGDDGRFYVVDLAGAQQRGETPMKPGDRLSLLGVEGVRPYQIAAVVVGPGETALAPGAVAERAAPPAAMPAAVAAPPAESPRWQRIDGTVESVSGGKLTVRAPNGRTTAIDISSLSANAADILQRGEGVTVFAVPRGNRELVAVGFIQREPGSPAALPRQ